MKTEKQLQQYIQKLCKAKGVRCYKMHCEGKVGFPDLLLAFRGHTLFIEVKSPAGTGRLSAAQQRILKELYDQDQNTIVIDTKEYADFFIQKLTDLRPRRRYF